MHRLKLSIIFAIILLSISSSSILVLLSGSTAVSCAFWRVFITCLILLATRLLHSESRLLQIDKKIALYSIISGFSLAVHFLLWMESLFLVPVAVSTTIVVTYPLFAIVIDCFIFKEYVRPIQVIGLTLGFTGVILFMQPWVLGSYNNYGILLSLAGALAASCYFSMGRLVRKKTDLLSYTTLAYATASIALLLYALVCGENLLNHPLQAYAYFLLLALIPMMGGHTLINYILKHIKMSTATSIALGEPIGASILAQLILKQQVDTPKVLVMTMVLSSIALTISGEARPCNPSEASEE